MIFTRKKLILRQDNNIGDALRLLNGDYGNIIVVLKNRWYEDHCKVIDCGKKKMM